MRYQATIKGVSICQLEELQMIQPQQAIRDWSFLDVMSRFGAIQELALGHGYVASIFGSTVSQGGGRDLDVLMTPIRGKVQMRDEFLREFGGQELHRNIDEAKGIWSVELARRGRIHHFVFGTIGD
jgi:hypothetical protein